MADKKQVCTADFPLSNKTRGGAVDKFGVPDYAVPENRSNITLKIKRDQLSNNEHPMETMAKANRTMNDIYAQLAPNEVLITNLPSIQTPELASPQSVADFLIKNVHKDLQVKSVSYVDSISTPNLKSRTAYLRVEVGSKRQAHLVKQNLKKVWIHDCLLKTKTVEDAKTEVFDNRTVIINGLPKHLRADQVIEYFGKNAGAVVGLEMPQQNTRLSELRRKQADREDTVENVERETDRRRAMIAVNDGLTAEANMMEQM